MAVFDAQDVATAQSWEANNHGANVPGVASWWGHCPGWTGAAMSVTPIQHDVWAASDGNGGVTTCNQGDAGCTHFEIGDIDALLAESYVDANGAFIGARCDTAPANIQRDQYGRIVRDGTGCKGLNAGALVIALAQRMKVEQQPMAIDAQNDFNTDQIWNQPAYRYNVYEYDDSLTAAQAANLVATGSPDGSLTSYPWDDQAVGFVFVDIGIDWVSEYGPNTTFVSGLYSTNETRFVAVLELDSTPQDPNANIIGGEFIDDPSVGADRLTVPPFVWTASGPGPDNLDPSVNGNDHNPYVQPSLVLQLAQLGQM
jgi:transglutaminase elicitor